MNEVIDALVASGYDGPWIVSFNVDAIESCGEHADGFPSWKIEVYSTESVIFFVQRSLGWYEQCGEATGVQDLIKLMKAMDTAGEALNKSLTGGTVDTK